MSEPVYKICDRGEWEKAQSCGHYAGSSDDLRDGYIHFSTRSQLAVTAAKHFAGAEDLLLVTVDAEALGEALKWEPSRGGDLFPHLYAPLDMKAVLCAEPLPLGPDGAHLFPKGTE